jgi:ribose/xylose/arabinose/galactoside ABC-type transport system permease subunit
VLAFCLVFISGEFDLSFMYLFPLVSIVAAFLMAKMSWAAPPAIAMAVAVAVIAGLGNGSLTIYVGLPSFFATISVAFICYGLIHAITGPYSIPCYFPPWLAFFGKGSLGVVPFNIVLSGGLYAVFVFVLGSTRFGRQLYAAGDDAEAARNMGIRVNFYKILVFVIAAMIVCLGGIVYCTRLGSGQATAGPGYMLPVLASVFLGMTMFKVGRATIYGALIGAFFMNTVTNGLTQMGMPFFWQPFVSGAVLIGAVLTTIARERIEI